MNTASAPAQMLSWVTENTEGAQRPRSKPSVSPSVPSVSASVNSVILPVFFPQFI